MIFHPTKKELVVLKVIEDGKWWYGLDIVRASKGKVGRGSIYTVLHRLLTRELITERPEDDNEFKYAHILGMNRRHLYRITRSGKTALNDAEASSNLTPAWHGAV